MKGLKIAFVDVLGLPYDGLTLEKRGLGGSESAVIHMSRELAKLGMNVTVYNDCGTDDCAPATYQGVNFMTLDAAENTPRPYDVVISSRSVAPFAPPEMRDRFRSFVGIPDFSEMMKQARYKILWMHDTFCDGDDLIEEFCLAGRINKIFTLSDWHSTYVMNCDHGRRRNYEVLKPFVWQTRNGIHRYLDFVDVRHKDPHKFIFNSSVTKGMVPLVKQVWPRVKARLPEAQLTVVGGYYKFADNHGPDEQQRTFIQMHDDVEFNQQHNIRFTGIITQKQVAQEVASSSFMLYPALFPETFGISALEALAYKTPIITNRFGALENIAVEDACYKIDYAIGPNGLFPGIDHQQQVDKFVDLTVWAASNPYILQQKQYATNRVADICTWDTVAQQWRQHLYQHFGLFLSRDDFRRVSRINHRVAEVFDLRNTDSTLSMIPTSPEQKIQVLVTLYNAEKYITRCLESIVCQDYHNYTVTVVDDASTDRSAKYIDAFVQRHPDIDIKPIYRQQNQGAVFNQVSVIRTYQPDDIVVVVDGDDWLVPDNQIFQRINDLHTQGAEFTYGSCWSLADNIPLIAQDYPPDVLANRGYREHRFTWNMPYPHLRTYRARLIQAASDSEFQDDSGNWYRAGGDTSVFYSALENAQPDSVVCVPDVLYVYNDLNPLNDYKINGEEQNRNAAQVIRKNMNTHQEYPILEDYHEVQREVDGVNTWVWLKSDQAFDIIADDWPHLKDTIIRNVPNRRVAVQAGGNQGMYPRLMSFMFDQVYTFEPNTANYRSLLHNIQGIDNIIPRQQALGAYITQSRSQMSNPANAGTAEVVMTDSGDIEMITIDSLNLDRCDLIQLDLEGYEMRAIMGAVRTIDRFKPTIIAEGPERTNDTITGILEQWGYELVDMVGTNNDAVYKYTGRPAPYRAGGLPYVPDQKCKNILVAIPTARHIEVDTFKSIFDLEVPPGFKLHFQYFYGYRIDQIRNLIADWMLRGDYDYLFSVDSDITFPPDTLTKFIHHDKDMVSGVYRQRKPDQHTIEIYNGIGQNIPWQDLQNATANMRTPLVEVAGCGFGCVLIKKSVFETIPYPHFEYTVALDHRNTVSEDVDFCRKATDRGHTIWCDTSVTCGHIGQYNFKV